MDKKSRTSKKIMILTKKLCGCHQIPERSFFIGGYQFPLCARCTGIMVGYIFALLLYIFRIILPPCLSIIMMIPLIADGGLQYLFCIMSNNIRRLVTGLMYGTGFIHTVINIIFGLMFVKSF